MTILNDDQYMERTPDLVARIRKMREAAEKEMNRFTRVADYDLRRVVGQMSKSVPVAAETDSAPVVNKRSAKSSTKLSTAQSSIKFAPAECGDEREDV